MFVYDPEERSPLSSSPPPEYVAPGVCERKGGRQYILDRGRPDYEDAADYAVSDPRRSVFRKTFRPDPETRIDCIPEFMERCFQENLDFDAPRETALLRHYKVFPAREHPTGSLPVAADLEYGGCLLLAASISTKRIPEKAVRPVQGRQKGKTP